MKINKVIETENGFVQFQGELTAEEFDLVVEAGLGFLLRAGVLHAVKMPTPADNETSVH